MDLDLVQILNQPPDPLRPYVYRGTRSRINKFGILHPEALDRVVRTVSKLRGEMMKASPLAGEFDFDHLCRIHHFLFQDVYDWAGKVRVVDFNKDPITEGTGRILPFSEPDVIVEECEELFAELRREDHLRDLSREAFADRVTYYIHGLYRIHPFRDGNGRSIRGFLEQLAQERGYRFDLGSIPQNDRHWTAREAHRGNMGPLNEVIRQVITPLSEVTPHSPSAI